MRSNSIGMLREPGCLLSSTASQKDPDICWDRWQSCSGVLEEQEYGTSDVAGLLTIWVWCLQAPLWELRHLHWHKAPEEHACGQGAGPAPCPSTWARGHMGGSCVLCACQLRAQPQSHDSLPQSCPLKCVQPLPCHTDSAHLGTKAPGVCGGHLLVCGGLCVCTGVSDFVEDVEGRGMCGGGTESEDIYMSVVWKQRGFTSNHFPLSHVI